MGSSAVGCDSIIMLIAVFFFFNWCCPASPSHFVYISENMAHKLCQPCAPCRSVEVSPRVLSSLPK